jgi:hypothetical protein
MCSHLGQSVAVLVFFLFLKGPLHLACLAACPVRELLTRSLPRADQLLQHYTALFLIQQALMVP